MRKNKLRLSIFLCLHVLTGIAQTPSIKAGANKPIPLAMAQYRSGEPHVAVNPNNPNHLLAAAMLLHPDEQADGPVVALYSNDRGKNWRVHPFRFKSAADVWCIINEKGEGVLSLLDGDRLWVFHSPDGGRSWTDSTDLGRYHDHEAMVKGKDLSGKEVIYLTSVQQVRQNGVSYPALFLARSDDGGRHFSFRKTGVNNNLNMNTMTPAVLSDGTLLLPFEEFAFRTASGYQRLEKSLSWLIKAAAGGTDWEPPHFITQSFGAGFPVMAVNTAAPWKDHIYWVGNTPDRQSILLWQSADKGVTWSSTTVYQSTQLTVIPNVAVNRDGIIGISFYERGQGAPFCQTYRFTVSADGGRSFSPPVAVAARPSCPDKAKNGHLLNRGWASGGHYTALVAMPEGGFFTIWADARTGAYQLYQAEISLQ
jgi:hypothetical protein